MSGQTAEPIQDEGGDRMFNFGSFNAHYLHIQGGRKTARQCQVCSKGLEGVLEVVEEKRAPRDGVAAGGGDNEGGDATPPRPDDGDGTEQEARKVLWK